MEKGSVKFFNPEKGYGFIKFDNSDQEIFVHKSGLIDNIRDNDNVEFDVEQGLKGPNAVNVRVI